MRTHKLVWRAELLMHLEGRKGDSHRSYRSRPLAYCLWHLGGMMGVW